MSKHVFPTFETTERPGLQKRELAAMLLMAGIYANPDDTQKSHQRCAEEAVEGADHLMRHLKNTREASNE